MRTLSTLTLACAMLLTVACADDGGGSIDPRSGTWDFVGGPPVDDTCNQEDLYTDQPGTFVLDNKADGTFTVTAGDNVFDCTMSGSSFSCPERLVGEVDVGGGAGLDAIATYRISVSGSFSSETEMSGRQQFTLNCEGADCATVTAAVMISLPCGYAQDFTASAQ